MARLYNYSWVLFLLCCSFFAKAQKDVVTYVHTERTEQGTIYTITVKSAAYNLDSARYGVFIPHNVATLQGVYVHQHGCTMEGRGLSTAYDVQYQAFAKKWKLAIVGPDLYAKNNCHDWKNTSLGSGPAFIRALQEIGKIAAHAELSDAPWLLWGHSGGGYWSQAMMKEYPARIMAVFSYSPGLDPGWEYPRAANRIPFMIRHAGPQGDECCIQSALHSFHQVRKIGGLASIAYTPFQHHNFSYVRYMSIRFFEAVLQQRLPVGAIKKYTAMRDMDSTKAWLGDTASYNIFKASVYPGNKLAASWLPDSVTAAAWREYVITGTIIDRTPPPSPYEVTMKRRHNMTVELSWKADADIESGISHFNIYKEGHFVARFPSSGSYQQFDTNGDDAYPLSVPLLKTDIMLPWNDKGKLSVSTVNHFGLESGKTVVQ